MKISGLDLNGWKDVAARDWDPDQDENEGNGAREVRILDGGVGSVAVRLNSGWIGGPQALLAPHGRGNGWGDVGAPERRVSLAQSWQTLASSEDTKYADAFSAATHALARGAERAVFTVPDVPSFDEALQGALLATLERNFRWRRLLWRPVAAFLGALEQGHIPRDAIGGMFRFLVHAGDGVHVQTLRLRRDADHSYHVAPERDGYGFCILPDLGLQLLKERAHAVVLGVSVNQALRDGFCEQSTLGLRLICGAAESDEIEILRSNNGNWLDVKAPSIGAADLFGDADFEDDSALDQLEPVTENFLLTPLAEPLAAAVAGQLGRFIPNLRRLDWDVIARGSLHAGRLIADGKPHYFDRLTPISLAVLMNGEPTFHDLVGSEDTLPADREYVSPSYRDLKWRADMSSLEFYVLKGETEIRHWTAELEEPPTRDVIIELRLRQTPGQSWAKLSLTSPEWEPLQRNPISLDWSNLRPIDATPEQILDKLRNPPPPIPKRIVEHPSIEFWEGSNRVNTNITALLRETAGRPQFSPQALAESLSRSWRDRDTGARIRPIGTDGTLPDRLPEDVPQLLGMAFADCVQKITRATPRRPLQNNDALKCLTWAFTKCPEAIQDEIVAALEAHRHGEEDHRLLRPLQALKVVRLGAGRAVTGVHRLRRVLDVFAARNVNNDTLNALAIILSRREEAPHALSLDLVDAIAVRVSDKLLELARNIDLDIKFNNALSAIAGLFRYREVEPYALLATRDVTARILRGKIDQVEALLTRHRRHVRVHYEEKKALLAVILEYLDGAGDPNILSRIENLDEG